MPGSKRVPNQKRCAAGIQIFFSWPFLNISRLLLCPFTYSSGLSPVQDKLAGFQRFRSPPFGNHLPLLVVSLPRIEALCRRCTRTRSLWRARLVSGLSNIPGTARFAESEPQIRPGQVSVQCYSIKTAEVRVIQSIVKNGGAVAGELVRANADPIRHVRACQ